MNKLIISLFFISLLLFGFSLYMVWKVHKIKRNNSHHDKFHDNKHDIYREIINNIQCMIALKSTEDFRYIYVNDAFCNLISKDRSEILGHTDYEIYAKDYADKYRQLDIETLGYTDIHTSLEEGYIGENPKFWRVTRSTLNTRNSGNIILSTALDITDIHLLNRELEDAREKAEESDRLKSTFLANMSHEIRTPLNAIIGFSELLMDVEDEEKPEYLKIIKNNNSILLRLINDILDMSKIESGTIEIKNDSFNPASVFDEIFKVFSTQNKNSDLRILKEDFLNDCIIKSDKNRFFQVCNIFMTNAVKYTGRGQITMILEKADSGIKITVRDTGKGIESGKHHLVFSRFEKFDSFAQGNGLGLAICKGIVETMKGKVGFESSPEKGSTFWAWVPCIIEKMPDAACIKKDAE